MPELFPTRLKFSKNRLFLSLFVLLSIVLIIATQFGEARELFRLMYTAHWAWLLLALALQVATYVADGAKWHISVADNGYKLKFRDLAKMSLEQLSMNQFIPSIGMAGNAIVAREMFALSIPGWIVMKAIAIDIVSLLGSYVIMTAFAMYLLFGIANLTIMAILTFFLVFMTLSTLAVWHFLHNHHKWSILNWFKRFSFVRKTTELIAEIPKEEVTPTLLFARATSLRFAVIILDALTLWVVMYSIDVPTSFNTAFIALVAGSIGGILSFLPGGLGGFEVACTGILVLLGTPLEAALAGTLLLRGLVLWLPLIPGVIFMRKELFPVEARRV